MFMRSSVSLPSGRHRLTSTGGVMDITWQVGKVLGFRVSFWVLKYRGLYNNTRVQRWDDNFDMPLAPQRLVLMSGSS